MFLIDEGLEKNLVEVQTDHELEQSLQRVDELSRTMGDITEVRALAPTLSHASLDQLQRMLLDGLFESKGALLKQIETRKARQGLKDIDVRVEESVVDLQQQEELKRLVRETVSNATSESSGLQNELAKIEAKRAELALLNDQEDLAHKRKQHRSEMRRAWFQQRHGFMPGGMQLESTRWFRRVIGQ